MKTLYIILFAVSLGGALTSYASAAEVTLRWSDNSDNETGFEIERREASVALWAKIGETAKDVSTFKDAAAEPGKTYVYRVCAYNQYGRSGYTPSATHKVGEAPKVPGALEIRDKGDYVPRPIVQLGFINLNQTNAAN